MNALLQRILAYMTAQGYAIATGVNEVNIVYIEGMDMDGRTNADLLDGWNDLRIVFTHDAEGQASIVHQAVATTEPGRAATFSKEARKRGGVARIAFGQHTAWRVGLHKSPNHPALVQRAPLLVHRDLNRDGMRTRDNICQAVGINQHSTRPGFRGEQIGTWSEGCLVGWEWPKHIEFMQIVQQDPRYLSRKLFLFSTTVIDGTKLPTLQPNV